MTPTRTDNLALIFQEVLTAIVRLRANRQAVSDAESFRFQMREALKAAATEAQRAGYTMEDIKLVAFATVAFLDESILNSQNPLFADWPRKPLQEELFGVHVAGETFFQNLQQLLSRNDSPEAADAIEVYYLCLLLGYGGRYSLSARGELKSIMDQAAAKIRRIRGAFAGLCPNWALPAEPAPVRGTDPWVKKLSYAAIGCFLLALILFLLFKVSLSSAAGDLSALAGLGRG
jgi:type VI secretion system protein ImpK